ncbi:MAG: signal recognition particle-docking protein FtsY [Rhodospirillales bacterium]|nr:signal recognition particle-docking protein FtsY [Alphaproteobacteria bacterium]MBL6947134.1 signal recognition particle-docking protein FtsY [Rhodospirillales bacterium]
MTDEESDKSGGFLRGLGRSSAKLTSGITSLFTKRKLDRDMLDELEELLITCDLGVGAAARVTEQLAKKRLDKDATPDEIKGFLADEIASVVDPVARPLVLDPTRRPFVILVCGVNGSGKTTTIAKLANGWRGEGKSVMLVAGDTFRAAAIEQLQVWGARTGCPVIAGETGDDPAGLVFDAMKQADAERADILLVDTAGRLQNKQDLMAELEKVVRVMRKVDDTAPHAVLLVMDATVGQNAHSQVEIFKDAVDVTGMVITKLDGSAKGGVVVALAEKFGIPVHAVGVGEGMDDLRPFEARAFARAMVGLRS